MAEIKDSKYNIKVGDIRHSNSCGDYIILEDLGLDISDTNPNKMTYYKVRFLVSGVEHKISRHNVIYGDFKDPYYPSKYGVGYLGEMAGKINNNPVALKAYRLWDKILSRCHNPNDKDFSIYAAKGIRVDPEWFNFTIFYNDIQNLIGFDGWISSDDYVLDKQYSQQVYSKYTCRFVFKFDNSRISRTQFGKTSKSGYHGVNKDRNNYRVQFTINGSTKNFGTFDSPQYAATVYNYYAQIYNRAPNPDLGISLYEALNHRVLPNGKQLKEMCRIVDNTKPRG